MNSTNRITPEQMEQKSANAVFGVSLSQDKLLENGDVPLVIKEAVEYLSTYGLEHKGLFRITGSRKKVMALKAKYDEGEKVDLSQDGDIDSVASLLKLFLKELPEGVIPETIQPSFISVYKECRSHMDKCTEQLKHLIEELSSGHFIVLHYLCTFFIKVASYSSINNMTLENLSIVLGPSFFRVPFNGNVQEEQAVCNALLLYIMKNFHTLTADRLQRENIQQVQNNFHS